MTMRSRALLALLLTLLPVSAFALQHVHRAEIADDPIVRDVCWRLLQKSRWGFDTTEHAAFIVRRADGTLGAVDWPEGERHMARWEGAYPEGTIAILHTHQNSFGAPSRIDIAVARAHALPVYVITRKQISKTFNGEVEVVFHGDWSRVAGQSVTRSSDSADDLSTEGR